MTNEELKKKIVDVINTAEISVVLRRDDISIIADELIKADIVDGTTADHYWQLWVDTVVEWDKTKQRAEIAKKALENACEDISMLLDFCRWVSNGGKITVTEYSPENATPQAYIERAEKELAEEEGKDD